MGPFFASLFLSICTAPDPATLLSAAAPLRVRVAAALAPALDETALRRARVGVVVVSLKDGSELYAQEANTLLVPASNVKLVTTAAALHGLGPDYQFPTEAYGALQPDGVVAGDLVFKGYGDPYLVPERVWYLASRLYFAGVRHVSGDLVIDDTYFAGPRLATGWEEDRTASAYMAPAGALSVGFNALLVHVLPATIAGQAARVLLDPLSNYATITGTVNTASRGRGGVQVDVVADPNGDRIQVAGQMALTDAPRAFWRRINDPPRYAGSVLLACLGQFGIQVAGRARPGNVVAGLPKLLAYESPRLAELIGPLNKYSNNFMAMQVAYSLGAHALGPPGSWQKGQEAIAAFLADQVGIARGTYLLGNPSGLHEVNRLSARQMVRILQYMHAQPQLWPEFVGSLAVAGGSGTLQDRMLETDAAHVLRAKTGTLGGASALSGYVTTRSGDSLAFSLLVNGFSRIEAVWAAQDRFGAALADIDLGAEPAGASVEAP